MSTNESYDLRWQEDSQDVWDDARKYVTNRAVIEQAKGMLMFVYGIDADEAFDLLRTKSQHGNVKLHLIAEQMVKDLAELSKSKAPPRRLAFDGLMLTAHRRIDHVADRQLDGQSKTDD